MVLKQQQASSGKQLPPCFGRSAAFPHASLRITAPNVFPPAAKKQRRAKPTTTKHTQNQRWAAERALAPEALAVLGRLAALFGLGLLERGLGDLLEDGYLTGEAWGGILVVGRET